jgi:hypothetical protein
MPPAARINFLGKPSIFRVPYPCAFMQWAKCEELVINFECKVSYKRQGASNIRN